MSENKKTLHIYVTQDAIDKLEWAKSKSKIEFEQGHINLLNNKPITREAKTHSDAVVWLYFKVQELSKVLKKKMEEDKND